MKKKKKGRAAVLFLFLSVLLVWLLAFLVWLFWSDLKELARSGQEGAVSQRGRPSQEKISEEDRRRLEEILKRP